MQLPGPCHTRPKAGETLTALQGDSKMGSSSLHALPSTSLPAPGWCCHWARTPKPQGGRTAVLPHIGSTPSGRWLVPTLTEAKAAPWGLNNEADVHKAVPGSQWSCQGNANHFTDRERTKATHKNESWKPSPCRKPGCNSLRSAKSPAVWTRRHCQDGRQLQKTILEGTLPER